jgi:hypothetical protein
MITRDIELQDAILDLLDNCIDGIARQQKKQKALPPQGTKFKGYWARITADPDGFTISDNCGGIPVDVAKNSAFRFGRPDREIDKDLETVGMYGIGMKRAVFKMGEDITVTSNPPEGAYKVHITSEWMRDDTDWKLDLLPAEVNPNAQGTKISVRSLNDGIRRQFDKEQSSFLTDLRKQIERHYALILLRGFEVHLNGDPVEPVELTVLAPSDFSKKKKQLAPFVLRGDFDDVKVEVVIGFYKPLSSAGEAETEDGQRASREKAGITVVCNDRIVLFNDKTMLTGWDTGTVPGFHNQFIGIAGLVSFRSIHSWKLPLNTTKRGIDSSSELYQIIREYMQDGLKKFTSFTNKWKAREKETNPAFEKLKSAEATQLADSVPKGEMSQIRKYRDRGTAFVYSPDLPAPEVERTDLRVCFDAPISEYNQVKEYLFGRKNSTTSELGRRCFDEVLEEVRENET